MQVLYLQQPAADYVLSAVEAASELHLGELPGDILIFLTGHSLYCSPHKNCDVLTKMSTCAAKYWSADCEVWRKLRYILKRPGQQHWAAYSQINLRSWLPLVFNTVVGSKTALHEIWADGGERFTRVWGLRSSWQTTAAVSRYSVKNRGRNVLIPSIIIYNGRLSNMIHCLHLQVKTSVSGLWSIWRKKLKKSGREAWAWKWCHFRYMQACPMQTRCKSLKLHLGAIARWMQI